MQPESFPKQRYAEYLARNGLKWRDESAQLVDAIWSMQGPFSAADVLARVTIKYSRPTVHRTLSRLVEAGLLQPVVFNRQTVYVVASADGWINVVARCESHAPQTSNRILRGVQHPLCALIAALIRFVPHLQELLVATHQRSVTRELMTWEEQYSKIASEQEAGRASQMIEYIESYYIPSDGYRADPETELALESQRKRTLEKIKAAIDEWAKSDRNTFP
jgi:Fe2+ or Zn2+ uptake regulation protein